MDVLQQKDRELQRKDYQLQQKEMTLKQRDTEHQEQLHHLQVVIYVTLTSSNGSHTYDKSLHAVS